MQEYVQEIVDLLLIAEMGNVRQMNILLVVQATVILPHVVTLLVRILKITFFAQVIAMTHKAMDAAIIFAITMKISCLARMIVPLSLVEIEFVKKMNKLELVQVTAPLVNVGMLFVNSMKIL